MKDDTAIVLIDDDVLDAFILKRALKDLNIKNDFVHFTSAQDALDHYEHTEHLPGIILLDINMPIMNGFEFLDQRKNHNVLKLVPTVVLSSSNDDKDVTKCYIKGVTSYIAKSINYTDFLVKIKSIHTYWNTCEIVRHV